MKALIDVLNKEKSLLEDIAALDREERTVNDTTELVNILSEKSIKQKELDAVQNEIKSYIVELLKKGS